MPGTRYLVPGTWYLVPGTRYLVPCTRCHIPGTRYQAQGCKKVAGLLGRPLPVTRKDEVDEFLNLDADDDASEAESDVCEEEDVILPDLVDDF